MKSVGVIVEYNPFHNGHLFHLQESKRVTDADIVIAVMSGHFLQRGEPALVSKWARTKMALKAGIDLVVELPYQFATQQAEVFANGSISLLEALQCDAFAFGSESGDIASFLNTLQAVKENDATIQQRIQLEVKKGNSYPKAISNAYVSLLEKDQDDLLDLSKPNNILGFHYVKALVEQNGNMKPFTITRKNAHYHDEHFASATIASATSIRKAIFNTTEQSDSDQIAQYVPSTTYEELHSYQKSIGTFHSWELYWPYLQYRIQTASLEELRNIYEVEEGIEYRLKEISLEAQSFHSFMERLKTKRYTWTRLQRMCLHILTNTTNYELSKQDRKASYIRILGMSQNGQSYLRKNKKELDMPIISNVKREHSELLHTDLKAALTYNLPIQKKKSLNEEYKSHPVFI